MFVKFMYLSLTRFHSVLQIFARYLFLWYNVAHCTYLNQTRKFESMIFLWYERFWILQLSLDIYRFHKFLFSRYDIARFVFG